VERTGPTKITSKKLIAVEGLDEKNFFGKLLPMIGISDFQIIDVGGKDKFKDKFPALLLSPGFYAPDRTSMVTHVAIIRDNDEDEAFKSVKSIVLKTGLKPPEEHSRFANGTPQVGIYIMPGPKIKGKMLEDLCLQSVQTQPAMRCVDSFADCISKLPEQPKNMSKAKVQSFLAAQPEIVNSLGLGAQNSYWDFGSTVFDELKEFLNHLK